MGRLDPARKAAAYLACLFAVAAHAEATAPLDQARELHRAGQFDAALAEYREIITGDATTTDRATAANNACVILLNDERLASALEFCELARELRTELGDEQRLARTLNNLGAVHEASGDYAAAADTYAQALHINEKFGDIASITVNQANLGVLALQRGRYGEALQRFDSVERHAAANRDQPWARRQQVLASINRGVTFERVGAYREALDAYRSVANAELDERQAADLQINIGVAYRNLGDPLRALAAFDEASRLYTQSGMDNDPPALWLDRGLVYHFNLGQPGRARDAYAKALELAETTGLADEQLQALYYMGRLLLDSGEPTAAQGMLDRALAVATTHGSLAGQWSAREGLARLSLARDDAGEALAHLDAAIGLIEEARADIAIRDVRQQFFGSRRAVYDLKVEAAWRRFSASGDRSFAMQAFDAAQAAKARELASSTAGSVAASGHDEIVRRLRRPLVEFYFAGQDLYAWYADGDRLEFTRVAPAADVRNAARTLYDQVQAGAASVAAKALADLLSPALTWAGTAPRIDIAPDGPLFYVPFELLPAAAGGPMLDAFQIVYYPSASVAAAVADRRRTSRRLAFAAVGPPHGVTNVDINGVKMTLPPLPDARREAAALGRILPGQQTILNGAAATLPALEVLLGGGADVVHFATHAILDNRFGPAIVLSDSGDSAGLMTAASIRAAGPFDVGLTVLAACRSGLGGIENGFAINSLGGSWLAAGSEAIVVTLWDVSDRYTHLFMVRFYERLRRGARPAAALAATKREFRDQAPNNPAWAAYVLIGDTAPLFRSGPNYWLLLAAFVLLVALLLALRRVRG